MSRGHVVYAVLPNLLEKFTYRRDTVRCSVDM